MARDLTPLVLSEAETVALATVDLDRDAPDARRWWTRHAPDGWGGLVDAETDNAEPRGYRGPLFEPRRRDA